MFITGLASVSSLTLYHAGEHVQQAQQPVARLALQIRQLRRVDARQYDKGADTINDDNPQCIEDAFAQFLYLEDILYRFNESFHGVVLCKL